MPRRRSVSPRSLSTVLILALLATSLLPTSLTGWVTWFRGPLVFLVFPATGPLARIASWLDPAVDLRVRGLEPPPDEVEIQRLLEIERLASLQAQARVAELEAVIADLQGGVPYQRDLRVSKVIAQRVSRSVGTGTIDVRRGRADGVVPGTVAIAPGSSQLAGVVRAVGPRTCTVHLLTDRRLEPALMRAVVMPARPVLDAAELSELPTCQLRPAGDGTLVDPAVGSDDADRMAVGAAVRLADETWPGAASMLVLGRVVRIDETEDPLFRRVVVRPEVELTRLRRVTLSIPVEGDAPGDTP